MGTVEVRNRAFGPGCRLGDRPGGRFADCACARSGQPSADSLGARAMGNPNARLLVEADELVYDNDRNTVAAVGNVQMNYDGRTPSGRPRHPGPQYRAGVRRGRCPADAGGRNRGRRRPVRADRRLPLRLHRLAARGADRRRERAHGHRPVHRPAGGAHRGRADRLPARHLHDLRALRGQPTAPAAVAGQGRADHPRQRRADDLLRERDARVRGRSDRVHSLFSGRRTPACGARPAS